MKLLARERRGSAAAPPARDILAYDQIIIDALSCKVVARDEGRREHKCAQELGTL
jgi:hypothetical protein